MKKPMLTIWENKVRYNVYEHSEHINDLMDDADIYWESEENKRDYLNKFETGELIAFWVEKETLCECCRSWVHADSLGGIHASSEAEALELFRRDMGGAA